MKTPASLSITSSPCLPAPAVSAQQACAWVATSPCAPAYVPPFALTSLPPSPLTVSPFSRPARPPDHSLGLLLRNRRPHAHSGPVHSAQLPPGPALPGQHAHARPSLPDPRRDVPHLRAQGHARPRRGEGPDPGQAARGGRGVQLPRVRLGAARLHPRRVEQGSLRPRDHQGLLRGATRAVWEGAEDRARREGGWSGARRAHLLRERGARAREFT